MDTSHVEPSLLLPQPAASASRGSAWRWRLGLRWAGGTAIALVCVALLEELAPDRHARLPGAVVSVALPFA